MKFKEHVSAVRQNDVFQLEEISVYLNSQVYGLGLVWEHMQRDLSLEGLPNEVFHLLSQFYDAVRDAAGDLDALQRRFGEVFMGDDNMLLGASEMRETGDHE